MTKQLTDPKGTGTDLVNLTLSVGSPYLQYTLAGYHKTYDCYGAPAAEITFVATRKKYILTRNCFDIMATIMFAEDALHLVRKPGRYVRIGGFPEKSFDDIMDHLTCCSSEYACK